MEELKQYIAAFVNQAVEKLMTEEEAVEAIMEKIEKYQ